MGTMACQTHIYYSTTERVRLYEVQEKVKIRANFTDNFLFSFEYYFNRTVTS